MIKIIKSGKKEFYITCPNCGCEFTYEKEDFNGADYDGVSYIKCPECGTPVSHSRSVINTQPRPIGVNYQRTVTDNMQSNNPCANCDFTKQLMSGQIYVGDTPCTWCQHNPFRVTCTNVYTATNTNTDVTVDTGEMVCEGIEFNNGKN